MKKTVVIAGVAALALVGCSGAEGGVASPSSTSSVDGGKVSSSPVTSGKAAPSATSSTEASGSASKAGSVGVNAGGSAGSACDPLQPVVPKSLDIQGIGSSLTVDSLGMDGGAPATPPFSKPMDAAYFTGSPKPGSSVGNTVMMAHTFRNGGALGNKLNEGYRQGMKVTVHGSNGKNLCYNITSKVNVKVKDYSSNSSVLYDYSGSPKIAIVVCDDFNWNTKVWESRNIYYATPAGR